MESILKNIYINKIQVPKIHGHMRLGLRGSRETEIIEHDNHMTDALQEILSANGVWMNPGRILEILCPTVEKAFGGILLTDKELPLEALMIPGGTEVTACAAYGISNSDDALTHGSYNSKESVLDWPSKKMTYVYDWTTNQGNGTISSAALTHVNGGICGYGDPGIKPNNASYYFDNTDSNTRNTQYSIKNTYPMFVCEDYIITAAISGQKLTVYKYNSEEKNIYPFIGKHDCEGKTLENTVYEKKEFDVTGQMYINYSCNDGRYVYIASNYTVNPGDTLTILRLDTLNMTLDSFSIKNTTDEYWYPNYGIDVYKEKIYVSGKKNLFEINLSNITDINAYYFGDTVMLNRIANIQNGKLFIYNRCVVVFDCETHSIKYTKLKPGNTDNKKIVNKSIKPIWYETSYSTNFSMDRTFVYPYLATINNLDKAVTKTADKTMKVTYTIQQE